MGREMTQNNNISLHSFQFIKGFKCPLLSKELEYIQVSLSYFTSKYSFCNFLLFLYDIIVNFSADSLQKASVFQCCKKYIPTYYLYGKNKIIGMPPKKKALSGQCHNVGQLVVSTISVRWK